MVRLLATIIAITPINPDQCYTLVWTNYAQQMFVQARPRDCSCLARSLSAPMCYGGDVLTHNATVRTAIENGIAIVPEQFYQLAQLKQPDTIAVLRVTSLNSGLGFSQRQFE